ncbi:hypothetical protein [Photobacterium leiognathi]|nr:hypothetical protein [Photobacterium leiognathi]
MIFKYSMLPDLWSGDLPVPIRSIYDKLGVRIAEFSGGVCSCFD